MGDVTGGRSAPPQKKDIMGFAGSMGTASTSCLGNTETGRLYGLAGVDWHQKDGGKSL